MSKGKIRLNTVNVIELNTDDCELVGIHSFANTKKGNKAAEKLFRKMCIGNSESTLEDEDIERYVEDNEFEEGNCKIIIQ